MEPTFQISVVFQVLRASARTVSSVNGGRCDGASRCIVQRDGKVRRKCSARKSMSERAVELDKPVGTAKGVGSVSEF